MSGLGLLQLTAKRGLFDYPYDFLVFGDSIGVGNITTNRVLEGYGPKTGLDLGHGVVNSAVGGTKVGDWAFYLYSATPPEVKNTSLSILGVNDKVSVNGDAANLAAWRKVAEANLLYMATTQAQKNRARGGTWAFSGSWINAATAYPAYNLTGKQTSTPGDTATVTFNGSAGYLVLMASDTGDVAFNVTIDGISQGSYSNAGSTLLDGFAGLNVYPIMYRFSLPNQDHTMVVTYTSGTTPLVLMWATGNPASTPAISKPRVFAGTCLPQHPNTFASQTVALNAVLTTAVNELASDGFRVYLVDTYSAIDPTNNTLWGDTLHPNATGHAVLATAFEAAINAHP